VDASEFYVWAVSSVGEVVWKYKTDSTVTSGAIGSDGTIYFGTGENHVDPDYDNDDYDYDAVTRGQFIALNPDGTEKWTFTTNTPRGDFMSTPAISSTGTIYIGGRDDILYAFSPEGANLWRFTAQSYIYSSPAIGADGTIYFGDHYDDLYAINPNGSLKWFAELISSEYASPAIGVDGTIYVAGYSGNLQAISPFDGSVEWVYRLGTRARSSPAVGSDGTIHDGVDPFSGSTGAKIIAVSPGGAYRWNYTMSGGDIDAEVYVSPAIGSDGTVIMVSPTGDVYCF